MSAAQAVVVCVWDDYRTAPMSVERAERLVLDGFPNCKGEHVVELVAAAAE